MEDKDNYFSDLPIDFDAHARNLSTKIGTHDNLGIANYAKALAEFIAECSTPLTIGVQGDWGIGKTSTLNLIKADLTHRRALRQKHGIIDFNTWHYSMFSQDQFLGAAVISGLLDAIRDKYEIDDERMGKGKRWVTQILKTLSAFSIAVPGAELSVDWDKWGETDPTLAEQLGFPDIPGKMLQFRKLFKEIVDAALDQERQERLVIFIDDLDRVKPIRALELLESLKNFLDVERCVFVIAVDYEVIQQGMVRKFGQEFQGASGKSFFDKIIQLPFVMPTSSYKLGDYIEDLLFKSRFFADRSAPLKKDEKQYYAEITAVTVGRNPRSIKRVMNYAALLEKVRKYNRSVQSRNFTYEDRQILYGIICMQIAWPEIFDHFVRNPSPHLIHKLEDWDYLNAVPRIGALFKRVPDEEQAKSNISAFFDVLFSVVDADGNGRIDEEEFKRIFKILQVAQLTVVDKPGDPFDRILDRVREHDDDERYPKVIGKLKQSKWRLDSRVTYKLSTNRYSTILINRRQSGSIGTLKKEPLIVRLDAKLERIVSACEEEAGRELLRDYLAPVDDASLTGKGDTMVKLDELEAASSARRHDFLKHLFDAMVELSSRPAEGVKTSADTPLTEGPDLALAA